MGKNIGYPTSSGGKHALHEYIELLDKEGLLVSIRELDSGEESQTGIHSQMSDGLNRRLVEHISYDSRDVKPGTLFICKGAHFKESFLADAIKKGAFCYVSEKEYKFAEIKPGKNGTSAGEVASVASVASIIVKDIRKAMALLANLYHDESWRKLKIVGITGTKGKSTTAYYVKSIIDYHMKTLGKAPCAIISSIDTEDGIISQESHITTPEALELHRHFSNAVHSGREYMVMEVSSQGLRYDRTAGVIFPVAIFLNIGKDHISSIEHKDFEDYFSAKLMLLGQSEKACINIDGQYMDEILEAAEAKIPFLTFGIEGDANIEASDINTTENGIVFTAEGPDFKEKISLAMTGLFNVENALAAIAATYSLGIPMESIAEGLKTATAPGRMELFTGEKTGVRVIVDYAHNKMSFESLFKSTREEYPGKKIFAVYGCPGNKAQNRRWELSQVAGENSAKIFITEEDHGEEDLMKISREIAEHVEKAGCPYEIENDRELAIKKAIEEADENTVILLTGKGRETRQKRGMEYVDTPSDVDLVLKYLK